MYNLSFWENMAESTSSWYEYVLLTTGVIIDAVVCNNVSDTFTSLELAAAL